MPKESIFKVQTISGKHGEKRNTFAKCKIDLAQFCSCEATGSKEVVLPLRCVKTRRSCFAKVVKTTRTLLCLPPPQLFFSSCMFEGGHRCVSAKHTLIEVVAFMQTPVMHCVE